MCVLYISWQLHCDFGATKDDFIRDRLALGLRDKVLSEQLQMEEKLTLSLAIDLDKMPPQGNDPTTE